ncbi:MAG: GNAT family N-acetyltransferase [Acidimicrobiales bacterium]
MASDQISADSIHTARLELAALDGDLLEQLLRDPGLVSRFSVPAGWPDADDLAHLRRWRRSAVDDGGHDNRWRARAMVDTTGMFVGHAGFHGPPVSIETALDDPTFVGRVDRCVGGVVEIGYTVLAPFRAAGFATEAAAGLLEWAESTGEVGAVVASVRPDNRASLTVLDRLGRFEPIGRCRDGDHEELVFRRDLNGDHHGDG